MKGDGNINVWVLTGAEPGSIDAMQLSVLVKRFALVLGLILAAAPLFAAEAFEKVTGGNGKLIEYKKASTDYSSAGKAWPYNDGAKWGPVWLRSLPLGR